jgi:cyanophycinase
VAAQEHGHLVIIGGGARPDAMVREIVRLAGEERCNLVIIPMASSEPLDTALYQRWQFEEAGCPAVDFVRFDRNTADDGAIISAFERATAVFFSGGDQRRLADAMEGTRLLERVRELYLGGGVVAGTSAGAAVMGEVMITGDIMGDSLQTEAEESPEFDRIRADYVDTRPGFGFVTRAIIDQHFVARGRYNRLLSLVLASPELLGIGIDESTAIVVGPPGVFRVTGESSVVVIDASPPARVNRSPDDHLSASDIRVHVLNEGATYDMKARSVLESGD